MSGSNPAADSWASFIQSLHSLRASIAKSRAINVNAQALRQSARELVQKYFRDTRPDLLELGFSDEDLAALDRRMQDILRLAGGRNAKRSYLAALNGARQSSGEVDPLRERMLGETRRPPMGAVSSIEEKIIRTLRDLAPTAALSYQQALNDLNDDGRVSFRGPAHELREAMREALDRLAPDAEVEAAEGYRHEDGQSKPTQKQKMRFLLKARGLSATARKTPEETVSLVEELTASVTRASYQRSSLAAHVGSSKGEVLQLKMYVDTALAEILEIHRTA
jgi:hypothetical protein